MNESKLNGKALLISFIVISIYIVIYETVFHGTCMKSIYEATASSWRPKAEMESMIHWLMLGQIIFAAAFTIIFAKGYEGDGIAEGIRYGLLMGVFVAAPNLIWYAVAPYPGIMISKWMFGALIEMTIGGVILSFTYKAKE